MISPRAEVTEILENAIQLADGVKPKQDQAIHGNPKAFRQLCNGDMSWVPSYADFMGIQTYVTEYHRNEEGRWLANLCLSNNCDPVVFPLTISFLDRYLCKAPVQMNELRYVSSACFFIACKLKMANPPRFDRVQMTYPHMSTRTIMKYELDISQTLGWEFNTPTPYEYFDHLLALCEPFQVFKAEFENAIYKMCTESRWSFYSPQTQTAAAIYYCVALDRGRQFHCHDWFRHFHQLRFCFTTAKSIAGQLLDIRSSSSPSTSLHPQPSYPASPYVYYDSYSVEYNYNLYAGQDWDGTGNWDPSSTNAYSLLF